MPYYKVVRLEGHAIRSSTVEEPQMIVDYHMHEFVKAPEWLEAGGYGLFVFDSKLEALLYWDCRETTEGYLVSFGVFECEIGKVLPQAVICCTLMLYRFAAKRDFEIPHTHPLGHWDHSVMTDKVKLLRKV